MTREQAASLVAKLETLWMQTFGSISDLDTDLAMLHRRFFNPVATGRTLRAAIEKLPVSPATDLPTALAVSAGSDRCLPTPEARLSIQLISTTPASGDTVTISREDAASGVEYLATVYRKWARHRLDETVDLLEGRGRLLQLMPIGGLLTLLVNRADDVTRAIPRFDKGTREAERVDNAFFAPAAAFAETIKPRKKGTAPERLISGWTLSEIVVRLPGSIHLEGEPGVFVEPSRRTQALDLIVRELEHRGIERDLVAQGFDALVNELRVHGAALAGLGVLFERPASTDRLRSDLLGRFR